MPKLVSIPRYRFHKPSGQAIIEVRGRRTYLGPHGSTESLDRYEKFVNDFRANAQRKAVEVRANLLAVQYHQVDDPNDFTISELVLRYVQHCQRFYNRDGVQTGTAENIGRQLKHFELKFGNDVASSFGPRRLLEFQEHLASKKFRRRSGKKSGPDPQPMQMSRKFCNMVVATVKGMFEWAVAHELVPVANYASLCTVSGLRKGKSTARETEGIKPVAAADVDKTLPFLPTIPRAMVKLQLLSGCRAGELCIMRPRDIERGPHGVLVYRPAAHKTMESGAKRTIYFGHKARMILQLFRLSFGSKGGIE